MPVKASMVLICLSAIHYIQCSPKHYQQTSYVTDDNSYLNTETKAKRDIETGKIKDKHDKTTYQENNREVSGNLLEKFQKEIKHRESRQTDSPVYCARPYTGPACDPEDPYRTADGVCNNLEHPTWGASFTPQQRLQHPVYNDGVDSSRQRDVSGFPLPSARMISNAVFRGDGPTPMNPKLTMMVMQLGQLLDHELVATPVIKDANGKAIVCCGKEAENRSECFPIRIPHNDPFFENKTCMNFVRSVAAPTYDCDTDVREQENHITSLIDGSAVYGSQLSETLSLRSMSGGRLKTGENNLLPKNTNNSCVLEDPEDFCLKAGKYVLKDVSNLMARYPKDISYKKV